MSEIGIVREYGNGITTSRKLNLTLESPLVKDMLDQDMGKLQKLFDYLKLVKYVEPLHHIEGPVTDIDTKQFGWYGRVAAPGFDAFAEHFACHKEHLPRAITGKFVWRIIKRWINEKMEEKDYE